MKTEKPFKSGYIALFGRPNTGKTTLLNRLVGQRIAIVSHKPQTTRHRILGVTTDEQAQLIYFDTPGVVLNPQLLDDRLRSTALQALADADVVLGMFDAHREWGEEDHFIATTLKQCQKKVIIVINKSDLTNKAEVEACLEEVRHVLQGQIPHLAISALKGDGVEDLISNIKDLLPEGPLFYPEDTLTDQPEKLIAAEVVREKIFTATGQEIPYATAVQVDEYKETDDKIDIAATVYVERDSLKGMIIGKKGQKLKEIGTAARLDLQEQIGKKVNLRLYVKVWKNWRKDPRALEEFGY